MKQYYRRVLTAVFTLCMGTLCASQVPDISNWKDRTKENMPLLLEDFDGTPAKEWIIPKTAKITRGTGYNGTSALMLERTDQNQNIYIEGLAKIKLPLQPGHSYCFSGMYRTEDIKVRSHMNFSVSLLAEKNGQESNIASPMEFEESKDFKPFSFVVSSFSGDNFMLLRLFYSTSGRIYFDNLKVEPVTQGMGQILFLEPSKLELDDKGSIRLRFILSDKTPCSVIVRCGGKETIADIDMKTGEAAVELGNFPFGEYKAEFILINKAEKSILNKSSSTLFRRGPSKAKGVIAFDRYGRVTMDGKTFFPVGIFVSRVRTEADVKRIADAGFDFIINYGTMGLNIQEKENEISRNAEYTSPYYTTDVKRWEKEYRSSLDILQKHGLKYIESTMRIYPASKNVPEYRKELHHPALFAHYISDEVSPLQIPLLVASRESIMKNDPDRIVVALTCNNDDCDSYSVACDMLGIDSYPINFKNEKQSMLPVRKSMEAANRTKKPVMFSPQTFSWSAWRPSCGASKYPTEKEMRSMVLLPVIMNCRAFCFYSYTSIFENSELNDPGSAKKFWPGVVETVKVLRSLEPWIMSTVNVPVKMENKGKSIVDVLGRMADGKRVVFITSCGPDDADAVIDAGKDGLKSRFGNTKPLGNGKYHFTGTEIDSDVLFE